MRIGNRTAMFVFIIAICALCGCSSSAGVTQESSLSSDTVELSESQTSLVDLSDKVSQAYWLYCDNGSYKNASLLDFQLVFSDDVTTDGAFNYRYEFTLDEEVIFDSDYIPVEDSTVHCVYSADDGQLLKQGSYAITCYDDNDNIIATSSINAEISANAAPAMDEDTKSAEDDDYLSGCIFEVKDDDFAGHVDLVNSGWWDYDGTSVGKSAYASDTTKIGLSISLIDEDYDTVYYAYYYSEDGKFSDDDSLDAVYTNAVQATEYSDSVSFDIDYQPETMNKGYYFVIVATDPNFDNVVINGSCLIVEETSEEAQG